jgi:hypothetical protein
LSDASWVEEIRMTPEEVIAKVKARAKANFRTGLN